MADRLVDFHLRPIGLEPPAHFMPRWHYPRNPHLAIGNAHPFAQSPLPIAELERNPDRQNIKPAKSQYGPRTQSRKEKPSREQGHRDNSHDDHKAFIGQGSVRIKNSIKIAFRVAHRLEAWLLKAASLGQRRHGFHGGYLGHRKNIRPQGTWSQLRKAELYLRFAGVMVATKIKKGRLCPAK